MTRKVLLCVAVAAAAFVSCVTSSPWQYPWQIKKPITEKVLHLDRSKHEIQQVALWWLLEGMKEPLPSWEARGVVRRDENADGVIRIVARLHSRRFTGAYVAVECTLGLDIMDESTVVEIGDFVFFKQEPSAPGPRSYAAASFIDYHARLLMEHTESALSTAPVPEEGFFGQRPKNPE